MSNSKQPVHKKIQDSRRMHVDQVFSQSPVSLSPRGIEMIERQRLLQLKSDEESIHHIVNGVFDDVCGRGYDMRELEVDLQDEIKEAWATIIRGYLNR